jgi:hypothetical protein
MPSSGSFPSLPVTESTSMATIVVASGGTLDPQYVLGRVYVSGESGKLYIFLQLDPTLINDTFANNEVACLKADWVATNDVSDAVESGTYPIVVGVARGSYAESTSAGSTRYAFFQCWGRGLVKTNGDDDIAAGVRLIAATGTDGACDSLAGSSTSADGIITQMTVGYSAAADVDAANTVDAFIRAGFCF